MARTRWKIGCSTLSACRSSRFCRGGCYLTDSDTSGAAHCLKSRHPADQALPCVVAVRVDSGETSFDTHTQTCSQPTLPFAPGVGQAGALTTLYCVTPDSACLPGPAASSSTRPAASASRRTTRLSSGCSPQSRQPGRWRLNQRQSVLAGEIKEAYFTVDAQKFSYSARELGQLQRRCSTPMI